MTTSALEIRGLEKSFPRFKLGPIDITVPAGGIYGLIGPNGAGKTTTIDLILGIGSYDAGHIKVMGMNPKEQEIAVKSRLGYVSPDLNFNLWRNVGRLITFVRQYYPDWDDIYCRHLLKRMNIAWEDEIKTVSFGTRVKLALVIALSHKPDLLLLDEPTLGVDAVSKREIFSELLSAVQDERRAVLIASHGLSDLERFADHIGIIHRGQILLEDSTASILDRFRIIDITYNGTALPPIFSKAYIKEHSDDRWRLLIEYQNGLEAQLQSMGIQQLASSAVNLEDLFITMVRED